MVAARPLALTATQWLLLACMVCAGLAAPLAARAQAAAVGEVEFSRGVGFAQGEGKLPRTLGKGLALNEGDRLTTSDGSSAIVKLQDGTRMTLRPNSDIVLQRYQFKEGAQDNSMVMQLLRGGLRAITGLISKNAPNSTRIQTPTATIGIRGTDFDARICSGDCKAEAQQLKEKPHANAVLASAKLVNVQGEVNAVDVASVRRRVVDGASVYPGETVETSAGARAVLIFRDDSRTTLGANTRFRVDNFVFDEQNPREGRFLVSLLRGSLRALTGLIGKANNRNVGFTTPTATIGIRGTGLDMDCGDGADGACNLFTWQGTIEVTQVGQNAMQLLEAGQGLYVPRVGNIRPLTAPTLQQLPRPDGVNANVKQLFSATGNTDDKDGLYLYVRDGHVEITTAREVLQLGKGETGFADDTGRTIRPALTPLFLEFDRIPMPNSKNPLVQTVVNDVGARGSNQCK
jgi:hypothetical protein